jgi:hypothetical protein
VGNETLAVLRAHLRTRIATIIMTRRVKFLASVHE